MSHFSTIVAVPGHIAPEDIQAVVETILQPFHEFECTGVDDEYVVDVDRTIEARAQYEKDKTIMIKCPDGSLTSPFYRGAYKPQFCVTENEGDTLLAHRTLHVPQGHEEVQVPTKDVQSFETFAREYYGVDDNKYGRIERDDNNNVRVIDRTNPNKKWDWWVIGGRWAGLFLPEGAQGDPNTPAFVQSLTNEGNIIRKGGWPYQAAMDAARARWSRYYDDMRAEIDKHSPLLSPDDIAVRDYGVPVDQLGDGDKVQKVYATYREQPVLEAMHNVKRFDEPDETIMGFFSLSDEYTLPKDQFVELKAWATVGSYAFVGLDGKWLEKAEMGAFASEGERNSNWPADAITVLSAMPDDTWLVAVDCHI